MSEHKHDQEQRLKEKGWTKIAPGIWLGQNPRPFIGPRTKEQQEKLDRWDKLFSVVRAQGN